MAFQKPCGPCLGRGYYGLDFKNTCTICSGNRVLEVAGDPRNYRNCGPCLGRGYFGLDFKDTCTICHGIGLIPVTTPNDPVPQGPPELVACASEREQLPAIQIFDAHHLHSAIVEESRALFADGHYSQSIFEAFKRVNNEVKAVSGLSDRDGKDLMANAFRIGNFFKRTSA